MCKCTCIPKNSGKNAKCHTCHPERKIGKGHDPRKPDEIKAELGGGRRTGEILADLEEKQISNPVS